MNFFFASLPFVALAFLFRHHLRLHRPAVTAERYDVRAPSFCRRCQHAITERDVNHLHGELGAWRAGVFRRPCPHCGQRVTFTVTPGAV
ncbi:hypothetical protein D3875_03035 [Deinococcus cavernae]|uniref:Uncharacterized protein n=1 Tax=Deinococcus cavernae TaxID=2320857 RepID=A0A418VFX4_9DEIO|nr:hypothetical protein [Deinococcus cavernae]RJF74987.1 hypothetical protein D3875_03035 [Deinococcus cavernae]